MMYRRKLHVDGEDPQRLYRALRQLYSEGVRIPFGKPYAVRKNAQRLARESARDARLDRACGGLTLAEDVASDDTAAAFDYQSEFSKHS